jgi:hypothetical protein
MEFQVEEREGNMAVCIINAFGISVLMWVGIIWGVMEVVK